MDELITDIREAAHVGSIQSLSILIDKLGVDVNEPHAINKRTGNLLCVILFIFFLFYFYSASLGCDRGICECSEVSVFVIII